MHFSPTFASALMLVTTSLAAVMPCSEPRSIEDFQKLTMEKLEELEKEQSLSPQNNACSLHNARVRRDWEHLDREDKLSYIDAVKCLWRLPPVDNDFSPAQNYFDEYVAIHANLTDFIHGTGNFLTWHRYLMYLWEETLRKQCGYKGSLPYWNWFKYQDNLKESPLFDGSETSLGGDGEYFKHNGSVAGAGQVWLPSGEGGGCIKSGPFQEFTINIGPIRPAMNGYEPTFPNQLHYNPRCPRRDLTISASSRFKFESLYDILLGEHSETVGHFQDELQGPYGTLSMHGAGHYAMGGDGSDVFTSLNDPAFYQHHAMVDRIYWMWQVLHIDQADTINGTRTYRNNPPSGKATVDNLLNVGILGEHLAIKDMFNTLSGSPLCYIYL